MAIEKDHLWSPAPDSEMTIRANTYIQDLKLHDVFLKQGACDLSAYSPTSKLYILAHGHSEMPLFANSNGKWDATQLAALLEADSLPKDQRDIELLVCHAGESVNTKKAAGKLMGIFKKFNKAKSKDKPTDKLVASYNKVQKQSSKPNFFENDPERLLIPLAAQFTQALKSRGYTNIRVTSYKCPVAQYSHGGFVFLDLTSKGGQFGSKAGDHPNYRVVWQ